MSKYKPDAGKGDTSWIECKREAAEQYSWKSLGGEWKDWYDCPAEHNNTGYRYRYRCHQAPTQLKHISALTDTLLNNNPCIHAGVCGSF